MRYLSAVLLWSIALLLPAPSHAQDTSDVAFTVQMPDSVVVTASRVASAVEATGRRVSVYTQRDIEDLSVTSIDQLLDVVAGLDVQSRGGFGVQSDVKMRGSTFNGVLLLLDGARINDPMTGHFLMDLPVPLSEVARVEVLRGPATALYGPDALGGVVHLITKTALRNGQMGRTGQSAQIEGHYGKNTLYHGGGTIRHEGPKTSASAAVTAQGSKGSPIRGADGSPIQSTNGEVRTDFTRQAATAALSHTAEALGDATLYARAGADDRDFGAWHFYSDSPVDTAREQTSTYWLQTRLKSPSDASTSWRAQLSAKQHEDTYRFAPPFAANRHTSRMLNVQAQASRTHGSVTVTGGASGGIRGINSNGLGLHSDASGGGFLRLRWKPTARFTVNQSTRVDYDPAYGVEPTPQLYAAYTINALTIRGGGGRAVRAPNYVERYISYGGNQGTPGLDPEASWSGEAGVDVRLPAGWAVHVTGFGRKTEDLIDYAKETEGAEVFVARNLHRVETLGLETEASFDRRMGGVGLHSDVAYTLLDATLDTQEEVALYKYALTSARHLVQGSASIDIRSVTLGVQGLWKDRLKDAGLATGRYGVVHTRLAYQTQLGGARTTVSMEVRNLFDQDYSEVFDAPMPGRTLMVGATVKL